MANTPKTLDGLFERAVKARDEWIGKFDKDGKVEAFIKRRLDEHLEEIVVAALGLRRDHWSSSQWEINVTNGWDSHHELGIAIKERAQQKAHEWLDAALAQPVQLNAKQREGIRKCFREQMNCQVNELAEARARAEAQDVLDRVLKSTYEEDKVKAAVNAVKYNVEGISDEDAEKVALKILAMT